MKIVNLHTVNSDLAQKAGRDHHVLDRFARQTEDDVTRHEDVPRP